MSIEDEVRDIADYAIQEADWEGNIDEEITKDLMAIINNHSTTSGFRGDFFECVEKIKELALAKVQDLVGKKLTEFGNTWLPLVEETLGKALDLWTKEGDFQRLVQELIEEKLKVLSAGLTENRFKELFWESLNVWLSNGGFRSQVDYVICQFFEAALKKNEREYKIFRDVDLKASGDPSAYESFEHTWERLFGDKWTWIKNIVRTIILDRETELAVKRQNETRWWQFWRWL